MPGGANRHQRVGIVTQPGSVCAFYVFDGSSSLSPAEPSRFYVRPTERLDRTTSSIWNRLGFWSQFSTLSHASGLSFGSWFIQTPYWPILGASALLPCWTLWKRHRRNLRAANNLCVSCGYDLRATPDRCPECGTIPNDAKGAAT
jgi:hypothetical protein